MNRMRLFITAVVFPVRRTPLPRINFANVFLTFPDGSMERDAISALVDCAVPEKLEAFQQVLLQFVNQHLGKLNLVVTNLESQVG